MKVSKNTMKIVEHIAIGLLMLMGALFVITSVLMIIPNTHNIQLYCIVIACISGTLAMGAMIFEQKDDSPNVTYLPDTDAHRIMNKAKRAK